MKYVKFRFTSSKGSTAGLVLSVDKFERMSVTKLSALFPYSEARYMERIQVSPKFDSEADAMLFEFDAMEDGVC